MFYSKKKFFSQKMICNLNRSLFKRILNESIKYQQRLNLSHQKKLKSLKIPAFKVNSKDIIIITEPNEFHNKLLACYLIHFLLNNNFNFFNFSVLP